MSKVIRQLATQATASLGEEFTDNWVARWQLAFADLIIEHALEAVLSNDLLKDYRALYVTIVYEINEYFFPSTEDAPNLIASLAKKATEYCKEEYKDWKTSTAWFWEEKFGKLIVEECLNAIYQCDQNSEMILHEPYKSIADNVWNAFYGEDNE